MTNVQFGVQYNGVSMSAVIGPLEFARRMESLGYRSYFVPELETLPTLDPFVLLAAVAQHTERMRLGTGVAVLPFRTPYQMAKIATSIDVLSGGRMVLGLGSGGVFNDDFGVEGVRPEDRRAITDERLELVRRLLSEERVTHSGAFHRMEDMALEPRSVQQPHLPIWTGAMWNGRFSKRMLERTALWADGFHPHGMTPRGYAEGKSGQTAAGDLPRVVLLREDCADEPPDRSPVREDAQHVSPALGLLVEAVLRVVRPDLPRVGHGEGSEGEDIRAHVDQQFGGLREAFVEHAHHGAGFRVYLLGRQLLIDRPHDGRCPGLARRGILMNRLDMKWVRQRCHEAPAKTVVVASFSPRWASEVTRSASRSLPRSRDPTAPPPTPPPQRP